MPQRGCLSVSVTLFTFPTGNKKKKSITSAPSALPVIEWEWSCELDLEWNCCHLRMDEGVGECLYSQYQGVFGGGGAEAPSV